MNCSVDLHIHSLYSDDGEFSPAELVRQAKACGIKTMAISDHNCVRANVEGASAAAAAGITYIPAVEIDCDFEGVNLHLLGYGIDYESPDFMDIESNIAQQLHAASRIMLAATRELGFDISEVDMMKLSENAFWSDSWTGEMFAELVLGRPEYDSCELLLPYRPGGARSDNPYVNFYWDFYSQGKPCYAEMKFPSLANTIEVVHKNGGKAVLAHPGVNLKNCAELLSPIIKSGLDGLEAYNSYHSPEQSAHFCEQAKKHGLFITCGSDYHGKIKPAIALGQHGCLLSDDSLLSQPGMPRGI